MERCPWSEGFEQYRLYHDDEWGVPLRDSRALFELLMLEGAQAGLSWATILKKRENYRKAFHNFDPARIAAYGPEDEARLMADVGIVRNRLKVNGVIKGARAYLAMEAAGTRFSDFVWQFVGGEPLQNRWASLAEVPASTAVSDAMSRALKKAGFTFVGSTICYSFMQAAGLVNDHLTACPRHKAVKRLAEAPPMARTPKRRAGAASATIAPDESGSA
ncbi:DNA-3-methyladenine glycosylase I [Pandoraea pulmonicola]|uniref:DNA-3-methyladenine glycosylase I n=1 Tax=Pandoraea pulmonicola TaxID=93221 RepID=A0AAJ4Z8X5_PANPU|nr:DNA-3-methyladenine glycosylase I [Pandoraea pulmonicola]AJC22085.1 DNA-3-methyladenine glycosylase [Pandoraea pulmonicola]SUA88916.1 DNA-3-methyladenine glycosylase 1 [Pandoraea pulmonicola]